MKNLLLFMLPLLILVASCSDDEDDNPTLQEVTLDCNSITADRILDRAVYLVDCPITITNDAVLTIAAGSVFKFGSNGYLQTTNGGAINALGTADDIITFTGKQAVPNAWKGIKIFSNSANTTFRYCDFEYGGTGEDEDAAQLTVGKFGYYTSYNVDAIGRVKLNNCKFKYGAGGGLYLGKESVLAEFSNNTFEGNDRPVITFFPELGQITANNNYGTTGDYVQVLVFTPTDDVTIHAINVPYYFFDPEWTNYLLEDGVACTVEPGATLVMGADRKILVVRSASFNAVGTASQKITITGYQEVPGYWGQLYFEATNSPLNKLEHTIISYGGGAKYSSGTEKAAVSALGINQLFNLSIQNSRIEHSAGYGVAIKVSSVASTLNTVATSNCANSAAVLTGLASVNTFADNVLGTFKCN